MSKQRTIIYVSQGIGQSSMPFNEFFRGRFGLYPEEQCHIVAYGKKGTERLDEPDYLTNNVHLCSKDRKELHLVIKELVQKSGRSSNNIIHSHDPRITPALASVLRTLNGKVKIVHTVHNNFKHQGIRWQLNTIQSILKSDYTTFCSESALADFPLRWMLQKKISAIPNGVDLNRVKNALQKSGSVAPPSSNDFDSRIRLVTVTKASTQKNTAFLIQLAHTLKEQVTLKIIGNLPDSAKKTINDIRPTNVKTTGVIKRHEVYWHYTNSDIFVSSSLWEGLPIGVLEAMACKLPVILSDIPAHREIIQKDNSVYNQYNTSDRPIVLDTNLLQWQNEINWFVNNSSNINEIGAKNEAFVFDHFSLQDMHENYTSVYDKLV